MASDAEMVMTGWAEGWSSHSDSEDDHGYPEVRQMPDRSCDRPAETVVRQAPPEPVPAERSVHQVAIEQDGRPGVGRYAEIQLLPADPTAEEFQRWFDRQGWGLNPVRCPVAGCKSVFRPKQRVPVVVSMPRAPLSLLGHCQGLMSKGYSHDPVFYRLQALLDRVRTTETDFGNIVRRHIAYRSGADPMPAKHSEAFNVFEDSVRRGEVQLGPDSMDFYQVWGDVLEGKEIRARSRLG